VLKALKVTLDGKAYRTLKANERKVLVDMRGRAKGGLVAGSVGRTASGKVLQAQRVYQPCTPKRIPKPLKTLKLTAGR
jgi:hypothetical protein